LQRDEADSVNNQLVSRANRLPFVKKGQKVHTALFLKSKSKADAGIPCFYPKDIIEAILQHEERKIASK